MLSATYDWGCQMVGISSALPVFYR